MPDGSADLGGTKSSHLGGAHAVGAGGQALHMGAQVRASHRSGTFSLVAREVQLVVAIEPAVAPVLPRHALALDAAQVHPAHRFDAGQHRPRRGAARHQVALLGGEGGGGCLISRRHTLCAVSRAKQLCTRCSPARLPRAPGGPIWSFPACACRRHRPSCASCIRPSSWAWTFSPMSRSRICTPAGCAPPRCRGGCSAR